MKSVIAGRRRGPVVRSLGALRGSLSPSREKIGSDMWGDGIQHELCVDSLPNRGMAALRLRPYLIRCIRRGSSYVTHGSRTRRQVALTFDDGPSRYTPGFVSVLRRYDATATFFVIGRQVAAQARTLRRPLRHGNEIANRTRDHGGASYLQVLATNSAVRRATGFRPCLFRRISGAIGSVATARALGMTTVQWDVYPRDWTTPGTAAIVGRVLGAIRPGSIVVMHDGGGSRWQTARCTPLYPPSASEARLPSRHDERAAG
jgi:peptidoglycan-N-acetylglucosamine deacetylase